MTGSFTPTSQADLAQRRQRLRRQRRVRFFQAAWRVLALVGIAAGLVWVTTLPIWMIRKPDQIKVEGNRFIPTQTIRSLMPIAYPQSLLRLEPQAIAKELKSKAPIAEVVVSRQLFPPSLSVRVKERFPVAITFTTAADVQLLANPGTTKDPSIQSRISLIDENGMIIPIENYPFLQRSVKLPTLRALGNRDNYRPHWGTIYRETIRSPVKISEIDFQNPANLVLKTEMGEIHLGPYSSRFSEQIKTLDRMRKLSSQLNLSQVAYIDLRNPAAPSIQMIGQRIEPKNASPPPDAP